MALFGATGSGYIGGAPAEKEKAPDVDELVKELVGPTGAWQSWSAELHHHDDGLALALGAFIQHQKPRRVIDMGCGTGLYVRALHARGIDCDGFDGHSETSKLTDGLCYEADFADPDLAHRIAAIGYDWCLCLEVFEHVPKELESRLVDCLLAGAGQGLVLSVATPGQGGLGHVNEQPHEYVVNLLEQKGLVLDENSHLRLRRYCKLPWFQQNLLVFRRPKASLRPEASASVEASPAAPEALPEASQGHRCDAGS